jgi:hypothetical protein
VKRWPSRAWTPTSWRRDDAREAAWDVTSKAIQVHGGIGFTWEHEIRHGRTLRRNNEIFLNTVTLGGRTSGRVLATGSITCRIVVP